MGVGLAVAVLIDATIIRAVLLPASMKLLGDWNWYSRVSSSGGRRSPRGGHRRADRSGGAGDKRRGWESRSTSATRASGSSSWELTRERQAPSTGRAGRERAPGGAGTRSSPAQVHGLQRLREIVDGSSGRDEGRHVALVRTHGPIEDLLDMTSRDDRDSGRPRGSRLPGRSRPRLSGTALLGRLLEGPSATIQ